MEGNFCLLSLLPSCNFFGKTCGMERPISVSELHAEKGVAVANAYGSIIGDNEDRVVHSTTKVCRYLYDTTMEISSLRFEKLI